MIVHEIEQGSMDWILIRLGMVTSTRLKRVFKSEYLSLIDEVIAEQLTEQWDDDGYISDDMQRGIDLEPLALDEYEQRSGVKLIRGGFIQSKRWPLLGYSPDGRCGVVGGVEVKCPSSKKHIQYLRQNQVPNDYKWQVFSSFLINPDCEWYDFMSYDPRVKQKPVFIYRTTRESVQAELDQAATDLDKFFNKLQKIKEDIIF